VSLRQELPGIQRSAGADVIRNRCINLTPTDNIVEAARKPPARLVRPRGGIAMAFREAPEHIAGLSFCTMIVVPSIPVPNRQEFAAKS
jgi:hypothetical protein